MGNAVNTERWNVEELPNARVVSADEPSQLRAYRVPDKPLKDELWDGAVRFIDGVKRLVTTGTLYRGIVIGRAAERSPYEPYGDNDDVRR
jgi:hypothetical protein